MPEFDEFPLVAEPVDGPTPETGFDNFPLADPTAAGAVSAFGRVATGAAVKTAPILGGMAMGAAIGAAGGPLAPVTVPAGAAIGAGAGFMFGEQATKMLKGPGITADIEDLPVNLRPFGVAGEVIGGAVPFAAAPMAAARAGARFAPSKVGTFINRIIDTAAKSPGTFATAEAAAAAGSGFAGGVAESLRPGEVGPRVAAEIAGGFLNPARLLTVAGKGAFDSARAALQTMSPSGRETRAAKVLTEILNEAGEDPATLAVLLKQSGIPGTELTSAQKAGSPALAALEAKLRQGSAKFTAEMRKQTEDSLSIISDMTVALRGTGDPAAFAEAAKLRQRYFSILLSGRAAEAEQAALTAAQRITRDTPAARAELGRQSRAVLDSAMQDARKAESELWGAIPKKTGATADSILARVGELRAERLPEEPLPEIVSGFVRRMRGEPEPSGLPDEVTKLLEQTFGPRVAPAAGPVSNIPTDVGELLRFRSRMLALAREASGKGEFGDSRVFGQLAEAALDDISAVDVPGIQEARDFSRALHDTFTRTFGGQALGTTQRGGARIPPELLMNRALGTGREAGDLRLREMEEATRFIVERGLGGPNAVQNLNVMLDVQERIIRLAAADAIDPQTGRVSVNRISKFIRDNEAILDRFPETRRELNIAAQSETKARAIGKRINIAQRIIDRDAAFSKAAKVENPLDAVDKAIRGNNPVRDLTSLAKVASRGDAKEGFRAAVFDYATRLSVDASGDFSFQRMRNAMLNPVRPGQPSVMKIMERNGAISPVESARFLRLLDEADKIETAVQTGIGMDEIISAPNAIFELFLRVRGAQTAEQLLGGPGGAGSSLILAREGSKFARNVFAKLPQRRVKDVLFEAAKDPRLMASLLERPRSQIEGVSLARQIHAYMLQAGLMAITEEGEAP